MDDLSADREREVIVLLHGFMGSGEDWLPLIRDLQGNFLCLTPDLPGHGKNLRKEWPDGFLFPDWKTEIIAWLRKKGIRSFHLAGYSMGGRLALYIAIHHPDKVKSLILESASPGIEDVAERTDRLKHDLALADQFESHPWPETLNQWYDQVVFSGIKSHPQYRSLYQRRLNNDPQQLAAVLRGISTGLQPPLWKKLSDLKMPVMLLAGEKDPKYLRIVRQMQQQNPEIKAVLVPGTGHNIHFEAPDALRAAFVQFLYDLKED